MDQQQFEQLLENLQSPDNLARKNAEESYENFRSNHPVETMMALLEVGATGSTEGSLTMALVLLRKLFSKDCDFYEQCDADIQSQIREKLLSIFGNAQNNNHRRNSAACVSALAVKLTGFGGWDQLWETLFGTILDADAPAEHRASSCDVINSTATVLATTYLKNHQKQLAQGLQSCVTDSNINVKKSAFDAVHSVVTVVDNKDYNNFRPLIGYMLDGIEKTLNDEDWDGVTKLCSGICGVVETAPKVCSQHTKELLMAMMHVASSPNVESDSRQMAVEVMVSFAESDPRAIKKVTGFSKSLFELLFQYCLHPEFEDDWDNTFEGEGTEDVEGVSDFDVGATCLDRVATALAGKALQRVAGDIVLENIASSNWENRHAALTVLTYATEGLAKALLEQLEGIVQSVIPLLNDDCKYVQYAALQCFAQFGTDFAPTFQMTFHKEVLSAIKPMLQHPIPRIQATACAAINNFFDEAESGEEDTTHEQQLYSPYYHDLAMDLVSLHRNTNYIFVKNNALGALSGMISVGKKFMSEYVDDLVPVFQEVLELDENGQNPTEVRDLKCKAIECTTILASGVGWEPFQEYAHAVCEFLNNQLDSNLPTDDPRLRYLLRGWTCMIECMGDRSLPYLPTVMPPLLNVANLNCDLELLDRDVGDEDLEGDDNVQYVKICKPGKGEQVMRIKTAEIEDKQTALTIVMTIVDLLKGSLQDFLQPITECCCEQLTFSALAEIRETAAETLQRIPESYAKADSSMIPELVNHVVPRLLESIRIETEVSVAGEMMVALYKTINAAGPNTLHEENVPKMAKIMHEILEASVKRRTELIEMQNKLDKGDEDVEDDEEALEDQEEEETFLLGEVCDAIGTALRKCEGFLPIFTTEFIPAVETLIDPNMHSMDVRLGLSMLCEFCEHAPQGAFEHLEVITQALLHYAGTPDVMVCQPAFFGLYLCLNILVENIPEDENTLAFAKEVFNRCFQFLNANQAAEAEWLDTTCNAMSCAINLIENFAEANAFNCENLFHKIVTHLPGKADEVEAQRLHGRVVYWLVNDHPLVADAKIRNTIIQKLSFKPTKEGDEPVYMDEETSRAFENLKK